MKTIKDKNTIDYLLEYALLCGATKSARLAPEKVKIENKLAAYCREPKCPNFGQSASCPPFVSGPGGLRKKLTNSSHAIVIRIEIDAESLHGESRSEVMRLLHEITATVEIRAREVGYSEATGYAGGSCKMSFCHDHEECKVVSGQERCRYPNSARQSMSGFGVNVGELMKQAGWSTDLFSARNDTFDNGKLSWVAGLIVL